MDTLPSSAEVCTDAMSRFAAMVAPMEAECRHYQVPPAHERASLMRSEAAELIDGLLLRVARGHGALEVALGELLAALADSGGEVKLGFSGIGDLARERLGFSARTALDLAKVARALRDRPLLKAAVVAGEVSGRKANTILRVARGEAEAGWVERARKETVRELGAAVKAALAQRGCTAQAAGEGETTGTPKAPGSEISEGAAPSGMATALHSVRPEPVEGRAVAQEQAAQATPGQGEADGDDGRWARMVVPLTPEQRAFVDEALELAGKQVGQTQPRSRKLEAICQEYLGSHSAPEAGETGTDAGCCDLEEVGQATQALPPPALSPPPPPPPRSPPPDKLSAYELEFLQEPWGEEEPDSGLPATEVPPRPRSRFDSNDEAWLWITDNQLEEIKASVERETGRWEYLARGQFVTAPTPTALSDAHPDPFKVLAELEALAAMRDRWESLLGHLGLILTTCGLWRDAGFVNLGHYVTERLGMSLRTFQQRVALERKLYFLPALREACDQKRLSYEKARLVARCPDNLVLPGWIAQAENLTCVALREAVEADQEAQMCARGELSASLPAEVAEVVREAFRVVRAAQQRWVPASECLVEVCREFIEAWKSASKERNTVQQRVLKRDRHRCQIPGCSRAAMNIHHVHFRSHGGSDDPDNLLSLCLVHHLRGLHQGLLRILKVGTDRLRFELGLRPGQPPLMVFERDLPART